MSNLTGKQIARLIPGRVSAAVIPPRRSFLPGLLVAIGILLPSYSGTAVQAGVLTWLKPKAHRKRKRDSAPILVKRSSRPQQGLPEFFKQSVPEDLEGSNLNVRKFAEAHWSHSKKLLESATTALMKKLPARKTADLARKLCIIDIQSNKESLRQSAKGLTVLALGNKSLVTAISELNRIVTAPRQETLANFEDTLKKISRTNAIQYRAVKSSVVGSEKLIDLGGECYQTLELIPMLAMPSLDQFIQQSKSLSKQLQSDNEAFKGLLLNVQNNCEEIFSNIHLITRTVKSTLRYSNHFAFRQYPLINLPIPTREKLFTQIKNLKNLAQGIQNTLNIGDSQTRNASQQFSHSIQGLVAKIRDGLKYEQRASGADGNLPQMSKYAYNQVCGLFLRLKEGFAEMRAAIAKESRAAFDKAQPQITMETPGQTRAAIASRVTQNRLPLFLLGGAEGASSMQSAPSPKRSAPLIAPTGFAQSGSAKSSFSPMPSIARGWVKRSKKKPVQKPGFLSEEMGILEQELGSEDLPYLEATRQAASNKGGISTNELFGNIAASSSGREASKNRLDIVESDDLDTIAEKVQMMRMDDDTWKDQNQVPLMRLDDDGFEDVE